MSLYLKQAANISRLSEIYAVFLNLHTSLKMEIGRAEKLNFSFIL